MEGDVSQMSTQEIKDRINDLENSYAEVFGDGQEGVILQAILLRIRELNQELEKRKSSG